MEKVVAGTTQKRTTPVFSAKYDMVGLYHMIDKYKTAAVKLGPTVAKRWNEFEEVLDDMAEQKWDNWITNIPNAQKTQEKFDCALSDFVVGYAGHPEPHDVLKEYIKLDKCCKPRSVDPDTHSSWIKTLCCFANRLPGNESDWTMI